MTSSLEQRRKSFAFVVFELCQRSCLSASDDQGFEGPVGPVRHDCDEMLVLDDDPIPFGFHIVGKNRSPPEVFLLSRDDRRDMLGRPDLTVRMRIARTHLLAAVFEDLHMADARICAELRVLLGPCLDDVLQRREWELAEAQIMAWRITNNPADSVLAVAFRDERREVVREHVRACVAGVALTSAAAVTGTEVTGAVMRRQLIPRGRIDLPLPWSVGCAAAKPEPIPR